MPDLSAEDIKAIAAEVAKLIAPPAPVAPAAPSDLPIPVVIRSIQERARNKCPHKHQALVDKNVVCVRCGKIIIRNTRSGEDLFAGVTQTLNTTIPDYSGNADE